MAAATEPPTIVCINCTSAGGICKKMPPDGWTRVREFKDQDDETVWFTHVGYCPAPECQEAAAEEAKSERLLFT